MRVPLDNTIHTQNQPLTERHHTTNTRLPLSCVPAPLHNTAPHHSSHDDNNNRTTTFSALAASRLLVSGANTTEREQPPEHALQPWDARLQVTSLRCCLHTHGAPPSGRAGATRHLPQNPRTTAMCTQHQLGSCCAATAAQQTTPRSTQCFVTIRKTRLAAAAQQETPSPSHTTHKQQTPSAEVSGSTQNEVMVSGTSKTAGENTPRKEHKGARTATPILPHQLQHCHEPT